VNEQDLYDAIESGKVAGAALDVFEQEPPPEDHPLFTLDPVICTPHLGAATGEAQENVAIAVAEQIVDYLKFGTIRNAVNFPSIPQDQVHILQPYIELAEGLGSFAMQAAEGGVTEADLEFRGEAAELNTEPVTVAALKGMLTPILEETVNYVNAPFIAKERGIEVKVTRSSDAGDYHSMLILRLRVGGRERSFSGTLFSRKDPRIIAVDGFPVEIIPQGTILVISNNDRPGVIGSIGTLLAGHQINIAWMHFGRESMGGMAISVVAVDQAVSEEQLEEIRGLPNILSAKQVHL
jgi:D-3-phosphoglycerate dehydrogenase